ncbi:MAG: UDP-N-acetylmuramate dehydrogenase [Acidobacteriota bacterium]|nr:UDP-N-acetylmuramate dehydrogenase [Acidobacteriota bacterium]
MSEVLGRLADALGGLARRDEPLGPRTTYRVGGPAALWVEATGQEALVAVHRALASVGAPVPVLVVGKGSNLLVADAGFAGLAISLAGAYGDIELGEATVRAGAAAGLPVVARRTAAAGLRGLEWAVGVPGSVGGALRMNAGGHGAETAGVLARYQLFDLAGGRAETHGAEDFAAGYRYSSVTAGHVAEWAEFALEPGDAAAAQALVSEIVRWRRANQPGGSNAGSVFRNPPGEPAGALVERSGLKGRRLGSAQVSEKHANFIQADEGGSADDVRRLLDLVRAEVEDRTGVVLVPELHMVGFPDTPVAVVRASRGGGG